MKTREQERMQQSLAAIRRREGATDAKEYGRACLKFPVLVRTAGLCQAVAFYQSRKRGPDHAYNRYVRDLTEQLRTAGHVRTNDIVNELTEMDVARYILVTREALAIANWMRRFAQSELGVDDTEE